MRTLIWIASGLAAGTLARLTMRSRPRGFLADAVLGLLGSVCGAWLLRLLYGEVSAEGITHISTAFFGATVVVATGRLLRHLTRGTEIAKQTPSIGDFIADFEARLRRLPELERTALARLMRWDDIRGRKDPNDVFQQRLTLGERLADGMAKFGGSWIFLACFAAFMLMWMFVNTESERPADPYPFILLNLILSCLAAVQAPVIMMSQNRQGAKDRFEAQQDYQVNLRAEMQIASLHLKLDEARTSELRELIALQRQQLERLEKLERALQSP
jgi:uncharacterized membrane protein/uncharacterized membrane protein YeaQ/YmgE (transglycosylase-associated protein family)